ncbi:MAG TPA: PAS domain S-box protein, partial [Candidatus Acidoferrum sp.]|nr:PAS domain S-box protein [Candidatus Acidoferrum sp.]
LEFRYLSSMPLEKILATVSSAPSGTIVFFGTFTADVSGRNYASREVVQRLSQISTTPVFGMYDILLGYGIVGGSLVSFERTGTEAGQVILNLLRGGQFPRDSSPLTVPPVPMFDWRQLKRWHMNVNALPPGSIVINRQYTLWEQYHWEAIGAIALLSVQALLLFALLVHRQRRRKIEERLRENEERLRLAMNAAALDVWSWDIPRGRIRLSQHLPKMLPETPTAEVTFKDFLALVHPGDRTRLDAAVQRAIQGGKDYEMEYRIQQSDGTVQWISSRGRCSYDRAGPLRMTGVSQDITERKRAEEERQLLAAVVESSHDAIVSLDLDARITSWNPGAERLFGYSAEEVKGQQIWFFVPPESREETTRALKRIRAGELVSDFETIRLRKDGTGIQVSISSAPIRNAAGEIVGAATTLHDITARKKAEESVRKSEAKYRELYESLRDGFASVDMDGRIKEFNDCFREMTGYTSEELLKMSYWDLTPEQWHEFEQKIIGEQVLIQGYSEIYEEEYRRKDGMVFPVELRTFFVRGAMGRMWVIVRDITDRKRAEVALRESEERFRQVAENVADFIWEVDPEGLYRYTSPSVEKILGYRPEELVGKVHFYDLFAPEERDALKAAAFGVFAAKQPFRAFPNLNVSKSGRGVLLETSGAPVLDADGKLLGYRGADTDVTERKRAEGEVDRLRRELAHMSRVTMMGELTASLAHELNQPLTAIVSNAHAGERYLAGPTPPLEELRAILADVSADAQRAGEVIRRLRGLLKKDTTRFLPLDLNELIREVVALTQTDALIRHQPIALTLALDLPPIRGDRVQLQQVLLNLVLNGMEAMEPLPATARQLSLQTLPAGTAVRVAVQDRGPGIPPDKRETIFDAFVTTKTQGLGMGLAISRSIVEAHGGRIWVENNPERGATFWFSLPV